MEGVSLLAPGFTSYVSVNARLNLLCCLSSGLEAEDWHGSITVIDGLVC